MRVAARALLVTTADRGNGRALIDQVCINGSAGILVTTGEDEPFGGTP